MNHSWGAYVVAHIVDGSGVSFFNFSHMEIWNVDQLSSILEQIAGIEERMDTGGKAAVIIRVVD